MDEFLNELAALDLPSQLAMARANYLKSLALIRALKIGAVGLDNVTLTADGWQVSAVVPAAVPAAPVAPEQAEPGA